jgi:hypothetical protein
VALQPESDERTVYLCRGCHATANSGAQKAFVIAAPLCALEQDDTPSLTSAQPLFLSHAPTREMVVVARVV